MEPEPQRCGEWQAQSCVGRDVTGIPAWLDRHLIYSHRWPALPGEAQYAYEAPRTITGRQANRSSRLKALGNAVVPQQCYPVLLAIARTWLMEQRQTFG